MAAEEAPFWRRKRLGEMTRVEWESLCDGCGRCCLLKLEEETSGRIHYTDVACRLLDLQTCRCTDYRHRARRVPGCVVLGPDRQDALAWMPSSCAYRLLHEGRELPWWHPLVSGTHRTVHAAGISVRHKVLAEGEVDPEALADRVVDWPA